MPLSGTISDKVTLKPSEITVSENALMVPTQAIVPELKGQKVYLYKSGKVVSQKIETGIRTDIKVQATSGLNPDDTLITSGILQVKDGVPVKITEFN